MSVTPYELVIFENILSTIAEEMGSVLIRAAFSPNIKERRDLSCAIFNSSGEMIAQAAHIPVHLGSMSFSVNAILEENNISDGDVFILNDPFKGGTHLPDITCIEPIYIENKIEFFVASRAHHADIGGDTPGSMPLSQSIEEEGIIIPPSKLYSKGKFNKNLLNEIINKTRDPKEREGDFKAQIACLKIGRSRLLESVGKYSLSKIKDASDELLNYSENLMKKIIDDIPDGEYEFEDFMDDDGAGTKNIPICVKIRIEGSNAEVDFSGSSKKVPGCINAPFSVTTSAVLYAFQCLASDDLPLNSGPLRAIDIIVDNDSILNAKYPSAVVGGNVETSQRVVDVVFGALSQAIPEKIQAASAGTMNNITFGGFNPSTKSNYGYYETIAGGMGGRFGINGISAVQTHMTNTLNTPIEAIERELPITIESYSIRNSSGGKGKFNGGDGIIREYKFSKETEVSIITERRTNSPYGVKDGEKGKAGKNILISNGKSKTLPSKATFMVAPENILRIETPGGGGWGKEV